MEFPQEFQEFIKQNQISLNEYSVEIPRYIRITSNLKELQEEFKLQKTELSDFYSLDADTKINTSDYYNKSFFGMDISSGISCVLLDLNKDDHVLDLCAAPGSKTRYICDLMGEGLGSVTGVDFSEDRLNVAKKLLQRHPCSRWRLFLMDGSEFDIRPPTRIGKDFLPFHPVEIKKGGNEPTKIAFNKDNQVKNENTKKRKREEGFIKPFHATRLLKSDPQYNNPLNLYDKVIVDTECTHDGSISHLTKYIKNEWKGFSEQFLDLERLNSLQSLQRNLLNNGFRLLKKGGVLVYSTCSFCKKQNEDVVFWFLENNKNAKILGIDLDIKRAPLVLDREMVGFGIEKCMRLSPFFSNTSGFFMAKITKL
jgi:16S rRNA C967 or C1407 C5-methylase (RsmB/RsmF family)